MKWAAVEVQWDGAPPQRSLQRVIAFDLPLLDAGYIESISGDVLAVDDFTSEGVRFRWYKPGGRMPEVAARVGYHWPCKVRWQEYGSGDDEPTEADAWAALPSTSWTHSRDLGTPDLHGRIGRHVGGGKAYGRWGHAQPARRAPAGVRR